MLHLKGEESEEETMRRSVTQQFSNWKLLTVIKIGTVFCAFILVGSFLVASNCLATSLQRRIQIVMSFLTPPFVCSVFYPNGITLDDVRMGQIYGGGVSVYRLRVLAIGLFFVPPGLILWLSSLMM
jgi:hypothetical protein